MTGEVLMAIGYGGALILCGVLAWYEILRSYDDNSQHKEQ